MLNGHVLLPGNGDVVILAVPEVTLVKLLLEKIQCLLHPLEVIFTLNIIGILLVGFPKIVAAIGKTFVEEVIPVVIVHIAEIFYIAENMDVVIAGIEELGVKLPAVKTVRDTMGSQTLLYDLIHQIVARIAQLAPCPPPAAASSG